MKDTQILISKTHYGYYLVGAVDHAGAQGSGPEYIEGGGWRSMYDGGGGYIRGRSVAAFLVAIEADEKSATIYAAAELQEGGRKIEPWYSTAKINLREGGLPLSEEKILNSIFLRGGAGLSRYKSPIKWDGWGKWEKIPPDVQRPLRWALDILPEMFGQGGLAFWEK